ncbi:MAG: type II secretion system F family protein [Anaerolineales bacterium]|nr:type II secretion system F family protein [Anaerolineales bacterium]
MPYRYLAYDSTGTEKTGILQVDREDTAEQILFQRGLTIAKLTKIKEGFDLTKWFPTFFGPKPRDVIVFSNQLANLIESGVALLTGLDLMAEEVSSKPLQKVLQQVVEDIRQGSSISSALAKHELVFPPIYQSMIQVGERTGNLGGVLRQLSIHMEKESTIKSKIKGAMTYPGVVLAMAFGVILLLLNFTLPPLLGLYSEFDAQLPWPTRFLMGVTDSFLQYRIHLLVGFALLIAVGFFYFRSNRGKKQLAHIALKTPVLGQINTYGNSARFSRTLATLINAGLQLTESMELTGQTIQNVVLNHEIDVLRQETLQGRGIAVPLSQSAYFPKMLAQVVRVGEETGSLDTQLITLATYYEEEVERALKNLTSLLEPAMMIFVGIIVGFVAISVILPMYSLLGQIK